MTFEFPAEEYVFLKIAYAKQGVSMKDFVINAVIKSMNEYEVHLDSLFHQAPTQEKRNHEIPLEQLEKE